MSSVCDICGEVMGVRDVGPTLVGDELLRWADPRDDIWCSAKPSFSSYHRVNGSHYPPRATR